MDLATFMPAITVEINTLGFIKELFHLQLIVWNTHLILAEDVTDIVNVLFNWMQIPVNS